MTRGLASTHRNIGIDLMLYPTHTFPTAAAPVLVGVGLALHDGVFALWPALAAFVCSWLVHVGGVFIDVYQLLVRHPAIREHPELNDAVAEGSLRLPVLWWTSVAWFVAALVPGAYLLALVGMPAIPLGLVGIGTSAWYAAGRWPMAAIGLAEPVFFAMFGVVAVAGTYYVQAMSQYASTPLTPGALLVGLPVGALVTNVLIIDDIRDVGFDVAKGWRTTAVRFGVSWSRREHVALTVFAYLAPFVFALVWGPWLLLPLATLPFALMADRAVLTAGRRELLIPWTPRSAFLAMGYACLLALGLALAR